MEMMAFQGSGSCYLGYLSVSQRYARVLYVFSYTCTLHTTECHKRHRGNRNNLQFPYSFPSFMYLSHFVTPSSHWLFIQGRYFFKLPCNCVLLSMPDTFVHGTVFVIWLSFVMVFIIVPWFWILSHLVHFLTCVAWWLNVLSCVGVIMSWLKEAWWRLCCHNVDCICSVLSLFPPFHNSFYCVSSCFGDNVHETYACIYFI
jgi:hypothetical protein